MLATTRKVAANSESDGGIVVKFGGERVTSTFNLNSELTGNIGCQAEVRKRGGIKTENLFSCDLL